MPALFTRISIGPNSDAILLCISSSEVEFETSQAKVATRLLPDIFLISAAVLASASSPLAVIPTDAPASANRMAIALPRPKLPPVIKATFPSKRTSINFLLIQPLIFLVAASR